MSGPHRIDTPNTNHSYLQHAKKRKPLNKLRWQNLIQTLWSIKKYNICDAESHSLIVMYFIYNIWLVKKIIDIYLHRSQTYWTAFVQLLDRMYTFVYKHDTTGTTQQRMHANHGQIHGSFWREENDNYLALWRDYNFDYLLHKIPGPHMSIFISVASHTVCCGITLSIETKWPRQMKSIQLGFFYIGVFSQPGSVLYQAITHA